MLALRKPGKPWAWLLIALTGGWAGGCTQCDLRGPGFRDPLADWGADARPKARAGDRYGFSTKAQQIEENVGS